MNKKIIIFLCFITIFFLTMFLSYNLTHSKNNEEIVKKEDYTNVQTSQVTSDKVEVSVEKEDNYKEINKNSKVSQELFNFLPKTYQTYPWKMTIDYMLYETLSRIVNDKTENNITPIEIDGYYGYKKADVETKFNEIYGKDASIEIKDTYLSPIEYFKDSDAFVLYPYSFDNTDNKMVIKSVEEKSDMYKVTVYSICVYVDMESSDYDSVYLVTKDTMNKYYSLVSRNDKSIISTYKKYELIDGNLDLNDVVEKYEDILPQIEFYIAKSNDSSYYISDIKDIY